MASVSPPAVPGLSVSLYKHSSKANLHVSFCGKDLFSFCAETTDDVVALLKIVTAAAEEKNTVLQDTRKKKREWKESNPLECLRCGTTCTNCDPLLHVPGS